MSQITSSPITNRIGAVFIHVSDMPKAIRWYSELLHIVLHLQRSRRQYTNDM